MTRARIGIVLVGDVTAVGAVGIVWFFGFDLFWATTAVLAIGAVALVIARFALDDPARWDPPARETPRATRLAVVTIEQALEASDRLARPKAWRSVPALLTPERDDRQARANIVRDMRALLIAELTVCGIDPSDRSDDARTLMGPDALAILESHDGNTVTSVTLDRCLDTIERLATIAPMSP